MTSCHVTVQRDASDKTHDSISAATVNVTLRVGTAEHSIKWLDVRTDH